MTCSWPQTEISIHLVICQPVADRYSAGSDVHQLTKTAITVQSGTHTQGTAGARPLTWCICITAKAERTFCQGSREHGHCSKREVHCAGPVAGLHVEDITCKYHHQLLLELCIASYCRDTAELGTISADTYFPLASSMLCLVRCSRCSAECPRSS